MSTTLNQGPETPERTIGQLVSDLSTDVTAIARSEIELAKAEITADVTNAVKGAGEFIVAGVLGLYAFGLLLLGGAWGIAAAGLPVWAGLLIMAGVLLLAVGILVLLGLKSVGKVKGKPEKAIANAKATVEAIKPGH